MTRGTLRTTAVPVISIAAGAIGTTSSLHSALVTSVAMSLAVVQGFAALTSP